MKVRSTGPYIKPQIQKPKPKEEISDDLGSASVKKTKPKVVTEDIANILEGARNKHAGPEYYGRVTLSAMNGISRYDDIFNREQREALKQMVGFDYKA